VFTGIIECVQKGKLVESELMVNRCWNDLEIGESISVNGVCLTLTSINGQFMHFDVGDETLAKTNLSKETLFNLERALRIGNKLSGHLVTGHVDGTIKMISKAMVSKTTYMKFTMPSESWGIVKKGSITLNGVSLTICEVSLDSFTVQIIPHTLEMTNLKHLKIGNLVNYEIDILARYTRRWSEWKSSLYS